MSKVKLDRILFDFMEIMTKKKEYNYEFFIHNLADTVEYFNDFRFDTSEFGEIATYFDKYKREETLEKLFKAHMFGYEEETDTYNIVLFEKDGSEYVIWEIAGNYDVDIKEKYDEDEVFKKSFTSKEIAEKFPLFGKFAQKNK